MKLMIMVAAWAVSAVLVLPTVSQGQSDEVSGPTAAAVGKDGTSERQA